MTHPTTLAEALEMVPVYVLMPYGKKRYMERRPIPQEVREAMKTMAEAVHKDGIVSLYDFREASMIVAQWLLSQGD